MKLGSSLSLLGLIILATPEAGPSNFFSNSQQAWFRLRMLEGQLNATRDRTRNALPWIPLPVLHPYPFVYFWQSQPRMPVCVADDTIPSTDAAGETQAPRKDCR
jgi:hypothetical protein